MKYLVLLFDVFFAVSISAYSQKTIALQTKINQSSKIQKGDNAAVDFSMNRNEKWNSASSAGSAIQPGVNDIEPKVSPSFNDNISVGIGYGLDFGGIGGNLVAYPQKNIGLFAGVGYALIGVGFNGGVKFRLVSGKSSAKVAPFLTAMYGYNAAISVSNATQYNKFFYGPTVGIGMDYRSNLMANGYWTVSLLVPIRGSSVDDYIDDLKNNHNIEFKNSLLPIALTFGYRIILN
jgi:hypothetical protein